MTRVVMRSGEHQERLVGGWLIVFCVSIVLCLARPIFLVAQSFWPLLMYGHVNFILTADSPYSAHERQLYLYTIVSGIVSTLLLIAFLFLFLTRSRRFPVFFLVLSGLSLALVLVDALMTKRLWPAGTLSQVLDEQALLNVLIFCAAWLPYILLSKRVKKAFVL